MTDNIPSEMLSYADKSNESLAKVMERTYAAALPGAVYSEPMRAGDYTVIIASEVRVGGGFGGGLGGGFSYWPGFGQPTTPATEKQADEEAFLSRGPGAGGGQGWGGGGRSVGRPLAIISIGPSGVTVKPVVDATKIALASLTVLGAIAMRLRRTRKANKR